MQNKDIIYCIIVQADVQTYIAFRRTCKYIRDICDEPQLKKKLMHLYPHYFCYESIKHNIKIHSHYRIKPIDGKFKLVTYNIYNNGECVFAPGFTTLGTPRNVNYIHYSDNYGNIDISEYLSNVDINSVHFLDEAHKTNSVSNQGYCSIL